MIGLVFRVTPEAAIPDARNHRNPMKGKVIYVHPAGHYATLEFKGVKGNFRESFPLEDLSPSRMCKEW